MKLYNILFEVKWALNTDSNVTVDAKAFAEIMDKLSVRECQKEPVITSGLRLNDRQVKAMFDIWRNRGPEYLIKLYATDCKSCSNQAGNIAKELAEKWNSMSKEGVSRLTRFLPGKIGNNASKLLGRDEDLIKAGLDILNKYPEGISSHKEGKALDYGLISNNPEQIRKLLDIIRSEELAEFEEIDESNIDKSGSHISGSHIHVTIHGITDKGLDFLKTKIEPDC